MQNFVKKKIITFEEEKDQLVYQLTYAMLDVFNIKNIGLVINQYNLVNLNKNYISEITESFALELNIGKNDFYNYIQFCTGRKILMIEKKGDFSKKIEQFNNFKYQKITMSNGNEYFVIYD